MKNIFSVIIITFLFISTISAQVSNGGIAPSIKFKQNYDVSKIIVLDKLDIINLEKNDTENLKNGTPLKYAQSIKVNLNPENSGYWTEMPNGKRVWRLKIKALDAKAIGVYYNKFVIPEGGELYLYNETKKQQLGAYTSFNNKSHETFANELIKGETVTIEYVESSTSPYKPEINISEIAYAFRDVNFLKGEEFSSSQSCQNNINCTPIGDNWQDEKRGVVRISIKIGDLYYWCTGSIINNTKQDCLPYILTADHCGEGATETDLQSWIFYFNYEATDCTTPTTEPTSKTMTGATHLANASLDAGSDFYLVMLETYPATSLNVYYNGWNRNTTATPGGVGIHHPSGDIKKISEYTVTPTSSTYPGGTASGAHWRMKWSNGVTEEGSSGSPLFDLNGRIIGDLSGGLSQCTTLTAYDFYGKFSYSWSSNGTTSDKQLKPWLDPSNSGVLTLDGMNQSCTSIIPIVNFTENQTKINKGQTISFTDISSGLPNWWKWTFQGGTPSVSFKKDVTVTYNTPGIYDVTLWIKNTYGGDTLVKTDQIIVLDTTPLDAKFVASNDTIKVGETINFTNTSVGSPFFYEWTFAGASLSSSTDKNPINIKYSKTGKFTVKLKISTTETQDSIILENFIVVLDTLPLQADFSLLKDTVKIGENIFISNQSTGASNYAWSFSGAIPNNSILENPIIKYNQTGSFNLELNAYDVLSNVDFISKSITVIDSASGIENIEVKNIKIYPNPANNILYFESIDGSRNIEKISIYNLIGEKIEEFEFKESYKKSTEINLEKYTFGAYFIKTQISGETKVSKVIIQK